MTEAEDCNIEHRGGCHCGAVQFSVRAPANVEVVACNCSICAPFGFLHLIVEDTAFKLLSGQQALTDYQFGTRTAHHLFCRHCGVKAFYRPRSHPNGWSVNLRCVDQKTLRSVTTRPFDGQNWEQSVAKLHDTTPTA